MLCRPISFRALVRSTPHIRTRTITINSQIQNNTRKALLLQSHQQFNLSRKYATTPMAAETDTQASQIQSDTGITPDSLTATLKEKLDATHVEIQDISGGCGSSFTALIVSSQFQGKAALARHRLVNNALKQEIAAIHAWTPKCMTPEQWEKHKAETQ